MIKESLKLGSGYKLITVPPVWPSQNQKKINF